MCLKCCLSLTSCLLIRFPECFSLTAPHSDCVCIRLNESGGGTTPPVSSPPSQPNLLVAVTLVTWPARQKHGSQKPASTKEVAVMPVEKALFFLHSSSNWSGNWISTNLWPCGFEKKEKKNSNFFLINCETFSCFSYSCIIASLYKSYSELLRVLLVGKPNISSTFNIYRLNYYEKQR